MTSALYPLEFGEAIARVLGWCSHGCDCFSMMTYARALANSLPSAQDSLHRLESLMRQYNWDDKDPAWPDIQADLAPCPDKRLVKIALRKKKLQNETCEQPLEISDDSDGELDFPRRRDTSPAPSSLHHTVVDGIFNVWRLGFSRFSYMWEASG